MDIGTPQFWLAALEIVVINILLSGDNAVVIALACRNLPPHQRRWGVFWGAIGAIILRIILTFFAVSLLQLSWLKIIGEDKISWYHSSEKVRRGFCSSCGSTLFWDPIKADWTAIAMGVFDSPTETKLVKHIFVADKGDYYDIADGLPQNQQ